MTVKRKPYKKHKSCKHKKRKSCKHKKLISGGGYGVGPGYVAPGYLINEAYGGPGKDCTGDPLSTSRPGYIFSNPFSGLPGLRGGRRSRRRGGMAMPPAANVGSFSMPGVPTTGATTAPAATAATTGVPAPAATAATTAPPATATAPAATAPAATAPAATTGVPPAAASQKGGRYGFVPEHLNPQNGQGLGIFGRIPCETGSLNPLNLNPNGVQSLTTASPIPPYMSFKGGKRSQRNRRKRGGNAPFPEVHVGQPDSMRYYAPTAGYTHKFETFPAGGALPGLLLNTPYEARSFNQACIKGGTRRRGRRRGGYYPVAFNAAPVTMGELGSRNDFDGTNRGLPVKFGGRRRRR